MPKRARPTKAQIHAVREVIYDHKRTRKLQNLFDNIQVAMNLNGEVPLESNDPRNPGGSGPQWYIPASGALDPSVIEAAGYCDQIASTLMDMAQGLAKVDIPNDDRGHLSAAISAEAALWNARGKVWRATGEPGDAGQAAAMIAKHAQKAIENAKHVQPYLKPGREDLG